MGDMDRTRKWDGRTDRQTVQLLYASQSSFQQGLFQQFLEKAPGQNWEKKIDLTSKLGEIYDMEHYKGSKIYSQNQVILDCIMPSIQLKYKCLSIILIRVSVSRK